MMTQASIAHRAGQVGDAATSSRRRSLTRALAAAAVGALCLAALVAIGIFLFGRFGETEARLLGTAVAVAGYSLTGLAASTLLGRRPTWLAPLGLGASGAGFVLMVALIWTAPDDGLLPRVTMTVLVLAVVIAHAGLLLPRRADPPAAGAVLRATLAAGAVLAVMLIALFLFALEPGEFYFRLLGVAAVLDVLGTLLVPILRKVGSGVAGASPAPGLEDQDGAAADLKLEVRFRSRTFVVRAARARAAAGGFVPEVREIAGARAEPIAVLADAAPLADPHEALALAVLHVVRAVDAGGPHGAAWAADQPEGDAGSRTVTPLLRPTSPLHRP
jgi:hypothetical protein